MVERSQVAQVALRTAPLRAARVAGRFSRRKPVAALSLLVVVVLVAIAVFAPLVAPYDPLAIQQAEVFASPGRAHFFGADDYGRDIFSRIIFGARISLYVSVMAVGIGATGGGLVGAISGYMGGAMDLAIQRLVDMMMSFPALVLALALVAALGASTNNVVIALAIVAAPQATRVVRSVSLSIREMDYITAAIAIGAGTSRIILRHVTPNAAAPWVVQATLMMGWAIIVESALSFLGLGTPPPAPSWGRMLSEARPWMELAPWMAIFPGLAITIVVLAFSLLGDGLRDYWDPRLRR